MSAPASTMLNLEKAWHYSTGRGVTVAVIDTGVSPNPRLPVRPGGDYVTGGDGLLDCDAHGTIVASIIAATPNDGDGVVGVAPDATLISIRQSSRAFEEFAFRAGDTEARKKAGTLATLARAIVHAANSGAQVINVSVAACVPAAAPLDQRAIGAAIWYAVTVKDSVIVTAAGNEGDDGCTSNPASEPRAWHTVRTVSSPSWFADYVLAVGAVDSTGRPIDKSLAGPWVRVAAPGVSITGLSPQTGEPVNAYGPQRPGEESAPFWGTSFSAAYVSGVVALIRAKYPDLSAQQVIHRIVRTAHNPPGGVDDYVGFGVVDPVAALTFDVPHAVELPAVIPTRVISPPAAPQRADHRARNTAIVFTGLVAVGVLMAAAVTAARRPR